jgi:hypothetical protein
MSPRSPDLEVDTGIARLRIYSSMTGRFVRGMRQVKPTNGAKDNPKKKE